MKKIFTILISFTSLLASAQKTIILQPDSVEGKDAFVFFHTVSPSLNDVNFGDYIDLMAQTWTGSGSLTIGRSYIGFDVSNIDLSKSKVKSATLYLYGVADPTVNSHQHHNSNASYLNRVTGSWDEYSITWNNQPSFTTINQITLPVSTSLIEDYKVNVTTLLSDALTDSSATNFGEFALQFRQIDEANWHKSMTFHSSDYNADESLRPKLIIEFENQVEGYVYNDLNKNCTYDTNEIGLEGMRAIINPGNIVVETDPIGKWYAESLPSGIYTVDYAAAGTWKPTCGITQSFTVTDPNGLTEAPSFGLVSTQPCSAPDVSIIMPFMRPGFSEQYVYVQACNEYIATGTLTDAYVDVALDDLITVDGASLAYTNLGDNTFRFDLGTLNPGQCVDFSLSTTLSTDAVLGQSLCLQADLFPVEDCALDTIPTSDPPDFDPCDLPWDKSSILVEGECVNDSIVFTITNTGDFGDGDMQCFSPVRLYIDGEYIWLDSVQLDGGETFTYTFAGDGRTWRLEVDQHPEHPGDSHPNATIELCGSADNWTPDLVNLLPMDDADPIRDIYCGIVTGSYDPNDKRGYPYGVTEDHLIEPNGKLEYKIRFQNTGTDTAFTVRIIDTLEQDLDIFSVRSGVSSHDYHFRMHGQRVLEWTFYDIQLPDSNVNEPASHGFVTFTVNQVKDLPDGTEINNFADIYFDYNAPIRTDTTSHIIGRGIKSPPLSIEQSETFDNIRLINVYPNPNDGTFTLELLSKDITQLQLIDVTGKVVRDLTGQVHNSNIKVNDIESGVYFLKAQSEGASGTYRVVVTR